MYSFTYNKKLESFGYNLKYTLILISIISIVSCKEEKIEVVKEYDDGKKKIVKVYKNRKGKMVATEKRAFSRKGELFVKKKLKNKKYTFVEEAKPIRDKEIMKFMLKGTWENEYRVRSNNSLLRRVTFTSRKIHSVEYLYNKWVEIHEPIDREKYTNDIYYERGGYVFEDNKKRVNIEFIDANTYSVGNYIFKRDPVTKEIVSGKWVKGKKSEERCYCGECINMELERKVKNFCVESNQIYLNVRYNLDIPGQEVEIYYEDVSDLGSGGLQLPWDSFDDSTPIGYVDISQANEGIVWVYWNGFEKSNEPYSDEYSSYGESYESVYYRP